MNKEQLEKRKKLIAELILENEFYVPMKTKEIAILLQIPKSQRGELQEVLDSLVSDGTIGVSKKGKYGKPDNTAVVGIFTSTRRGFGFVTVDGWVIGPGSGVGMCGCITGQVSRGMLRKHPLLFGLSRCHPTTDQL